MEQAIKTLVQDINSFLIPDGVGGGLRGTQVMDRCMAFLMDLQSGRLGDPPLNELQLAGLLHVWLENPDDNTPLEQWVKAHQ